MPSSNNFDSVIRNALSHLSGTELKNDRQKNSGTNTGAGGTNTGTGGSNGKFPPLTPSKALIIVGLLGDVFAVDSILVDKDQRIEIVLSASLKQKTQLEKIMDQVGQRPFDEVLKSIIGRLI